MGISGFVLYLPVEEYLGFQFEAILNKNCCKHLCIGFYVNLRVGIDQLYGKDYV